jgi:hypothetical protein
VPGQQFVEPLRRMPGNPAEYTGKPGQGGDLVQLGGDDQAVQNGGALGEFR